MARLDLQLGGKYGRLIGYDDLSRRFYPHNAYAELYVLRATFTGTFTTALNSAMLE